MVDQVVMWAADCRWISQNITPFAALNTKFKWLFWRESEIFLENETLYHSDTVEKEKTLTVFNF